MKEAYPTSSRQVAWDLYRRMSDEGIARPDDGPAFVAAALRLTEQTVQTKGLPPTQVSDIVFELICLAHDACYPEPGDVI